MKTLLLLIALGAVTCAPQYSHAGGGDFTPPNKSIDCYALIPLDLLPATGWSRMPAEDRLRIAGLVSDHKATVQRRQTLLCQDVYGGNVTAEYVISEWWWKPVRKQERRK